MKFNFCFGASRRNTGCRGSKLVIPISPWGNSASRYSLSSEWKQNHLQGALRKQKCERQISFPQVPATINRNTPVPFYRENSVKRVHRENTGVVATLGSLKWAPCMHSCYKQLDKQTHSPRPMWTTLFLFHIHKSAPVSACLEESW